MPRKPTKSQSRAFPDGAPSREQVLAFISGEASPTGAKPPSRITKREIARAFRVKGDAKGELKSLIRELESEGAVRRGRKILSQQGRLPPMLVADIVERGADGGFVATPAEEENAAIRIRIAKAKARDRAPTARLGARVLLRAAFDESSGAYTGRIVKILD